MLAPPEFLVFDASGHIGGAYVGSTPDDSILAPMNVVRQRHCEDQVIDDAAVITHQGCAIVQRHAACQCEKATEVRVVHVDRVAVAKLEALDLEHHDAATALPAAQVDATRCRASAEKHRPETVPAPR